MFATRLVRYRAGKGISMIALLALCLAAGCSSNFSEQPTTSSSTSSSSTSDISIAVSGASQVRLGSSIQFTATVTNASNTAVYWQVNGLDGGNGATGHISSTGVYTPPAVLPSPNAVTVSAVSQASSAASASAPVTVLNPVPVVTSASVASSAPSYAFTVSGTGFINGSQVLIQGQPLTTTYISSTQLLATTTLAAGTTSVSVAVTTPGPGGSTSAAISTSIAAATTVSVSGSTQVRLNSTVQYTPSFANGPSSPVTWQVNGMNAGNGAGGHITSAGVYTAPPYFPSPNTATITAVSTAQGGPSGSLTISFLNPMPVVTSVAVANSGQSYTFTVSGTGFISGSQVLVQGVAQSTTFRSATQLIATTTLPAGTTSASIAVVNPDPGGATSAAVAAQLASATTVSVVGSTQVRLNGTAQYSTSFANGPSTPVTWQVNGMNGGNGAAGHITSTGVYTAPSYFPASPGTATITAVSTASGGPSGSVTISFLNPMPVITAVSVASSGQAYTFTVTGTGFINGSQLLVQGTAQNTTFSSATRLITTATLPAGTTSASISVVNPDPGGIASATFPAPLSSAATISIAGSNQVRLGTTMQYSTSFANGPSTPVTWQVNGANGGSGLSGRISSTGLYTPPVSIPTPNTVTISAVSTASGGPMGTTQVAILNPLPTVSAVTVGSTSAPVYSFSVTGTGFIKGSVVQVQGAPASTTYISPTQLTAAANLATATGITSVSVAVLNPDPGNITSNVLSASLANTQSPGNTPATATAAARLLDQATFGPTLPDIQHVESVGLAGYLAEQFQIPPSLLPAIPTPTPAVCASNEQFLCMESEWWQGAMTAPDQLRQRVALALAEMYVVSGYEVNSNAVVTYQNALLNDAFGNFSTLMNDVTTSVAMGQYLNMLGSKVPPAGQIANENFARESMQLFSIGLDLLNQDGSLQLDGNGNPIPAYTQDQVQAFARAYTGWTFANPDGSSPTHFGNNTPNWTMPMAAVESAHDETQKILLDGDVLPAGQTAEDDLAGALQSVFNHPNVGPFVCRQLIQHLVTSNPSPAYVSRVAAIFANDGNGVRGNMQAIITAILMDPEARAGDTNQDVDGGHLREPALWLANVMRGLHFTNNDAVAGNNVVANASYSSLGTLAEGLGELPYGSSSVFNFFPPSYVIPLTTINAPEFGIENTASALTRQSVANSIVLNSIQGFSVDLSATSSFGLLASNPGNLVDTLNMLFMHGQMSSPMWTAIVNTITPLTDMGQRVRIAAYLVITSSQYKIAN